jgi:hypothetical protein
VPHPTPAATTRRPKGITMQHVDDPARARRSHRNLVLVLALAALLSACTGAPPASGDQSGPLVVQTTAEVLASCAYGSTETVVDMDYVEDVRAYSGSTFATVDTKLPDGDIKPEAEGTATASQTITAALDGQGRVTSVTASGTGSQNGSVVRTTAVYRDSLCGVRATSDFIHDWSFTVAEGPVLFVNVASVGFAAGDAVRAPASNNRWGLYVGKSRGDPVFEHTFEVKDGTSQRQYSISESVELGPGEYWFVAHISVFCCDFGEATTGSFSGTGSAEFSSSVVLTYPRP